MSFIDWSSALSVDVAEIDDQHKKLIDMLNDLYDAMTEGKGNEILGEIFSKLVQYTKYHFAVEEKYFKQFNYPDTEMHIAEHSQLAKQVAKHYEDFQSGALGLSIELMEFLEDWLVNHIQKSDKKYVDLFHANGLK